MRVTLSIVTDQSLISHTKCLTVLLTSYYTLSNFFRSVTFSKLIRISISRDSSAEFLVGIQLQVFVIVGVQSCSFCSRRTLSYTNQTIPSNTSFISTSTTHWIKHTLGCTCFVQTFTSLIPYQFSHLCFLLNNKL